MIKVFNFREYWSKEELALFDSLDSPRKIQDFLDNAKYNSSSDYYSPRSVIRLNKAHCFDGCLFAAAALRNLGYAPVIVELFSNNDDVHFLAIYKIDGYFGAIAKSNCTGLRFREAVYKSLRELVMSYFHDYFNTIYEMTLRGYSSPINLKKFDKLNWMTSEAQLDIIANASDSLKKYSIISPKQIKKLSRCDERIYKAGLLFSDPEGLYWAK